jgi:dTDP-4-dehydrorhamnose 3,5-epimerase-like enzyme
MTPRHRLIRLPVIGDVCAKLTFAQENTHIPFVPRRLFTIYAVAPGAERGFHAHREQHQFLMMMNGACTVIIDDGRNRNTVRLDSPSEALYVPSMLWLELGQFAESAVCSVLVSGPYDESDYIRDRTEFLSLSSQRQ